MIIVYIMTPLMSTVIIVTVPKFMARKDLTHKMPKCCSGSTNF